MTFRPLLLSERFQPFNVLDDTGKAPGVFTVVRSVDWRRLLEGVAGCPGRLGVGALAGCASDGFLDKPVRS